MKVKATQKGYYGEELKEVDVVFDLIPMKETDRRGKLIRIIPVEEQFSHEWMERVDGGPVPAKTKVMPGDVIPPPPPPTALKKPTTLPPGVPAAPAQVAAAPAPNAPTGEQEVI